MQRDWARDDDLFETSYVADPYAISDELAVRELHSADVGRACRHVLPLHGAHRLSASAFHCACRAGYSAVLRRRMRRRPAPTLVEADDDSFAAAIAGPLPVLVDLWAPWCEPCRLVDPAVEQAARDFAGRLKVVIVNVDDAPAAAQRLAVQVVPTLVVLHHGREVAHRAVTLPAAALADWLGAALQAAA